MATTFIDYTGDGNATKSFSFPSIQESDVKVEVDEVVKSSGTHYNITNYTTTGGGNVVFTSGNEPNSPSRIRIFRQTDVDTAKATYTAGSSVRAEDLNNNHKQVLFGIQEEQNQTIQTHEIKDSAVTSAKIQDGAIVNADVNASAAIAGTKISPDFGSQNIATTGTVNGVTTTELAILDGATVTTAELNILDGATTTTSEINILDGVTATTAEINKLDGVTADTAELNILDGVTATTSELNIMDGVTATTSEINTLDGITATVSELNLLDGVTATTAELNLVDGVTATTAELNFVDGVTSNVQTQLDNKQPLDSELTTLSGMQSGTASILADSTALTATTSELNQLDGITLETSLTGTSNQHIPTSKAVNDQILAVTNALGGFVAIANETSFPASNPDPSNGAGTVVSISQISSGTAVSVNNQGTATISNGAGTGNTVTITGFPSTLQNTNLAQNSGLQVQTTTTLHTYTFHKQLASADDIQAISATVNSFSNRYRVSSSAPTSSLDGGDLWYDTTNNKLMVYNSTDTAWEETTAIGNFFIATLSSSSGTGGGSATPNGTAYRFTLSQSAASAQQLIVSVDGVIQKPNSGTSQPSEGYVIDGNDIIFSSAPHSGASIFVSVLGSAVGIGTPSNNTVTSAILQNGSVIEAKLATGAVTEAKLGTGAVTESKIGTGAVTESKIGSVAVVTSKLAPDAVTDTILSDHSSDNSLRAVNTNHIKDEAVTLAKLEHGTSSNNGKFLRANNGADPTFETVNTDLVADTSPQLGGNLDLNSRDVSGTGNISINGNISGNSLTTNAGNIIINSAAPTVSFVDSDANPDYEIKVNGGIFDVRDSTNSASRFSISSAGEVTSEGKLNCQAGLDTDGNVVFNSDTSNVGVTFHANTSTLNMSDSQALSFGDHSTTGDYSLSYVNGSDFTILGMNGGSGNLVIGTFANGVTTETLISNRSNKALELYYNGSKKLETVTGGVTITGTCTATAFAGDGSALTGITSFVSGMIILWSGSEGSIPSGWYLCNGSNSTPDLRDRFIVGAGNSYGVGDTGGATTDSISVSISGTTSNANASGSFGRLSPTTHPARPVHSHTFSGSGNATVDTVPPYYALCYIMKS